MSEDGTRRWWLAPVLGVATVACFDGRDALGLPCEKDFQCGNGQICSDGECAWPGDLSGTSATPTGSSTGGSSSSGGESTSGSGSGSSSGGPDPMPVCVEGAELIARDISIAGSGNAMSVGVGQVSDGGPDVVVLTRSPGRLSRFRFGGEFDLLGDVDVESEPMDLAVADIDDDGYDDVVVVDANGTAPDLVVYWGDSRNPFSETSEFDQALPIPHSVDAGQMLQGGSLEVLVSSGTADNVADLFETDGRTLSQRFALTGISTSPWDTVIVDLDGEGGEEALVVGSNDKGLADFEGSDVVRVLSADQTGLSAVQNLSAGMSPFGVAAGDLDGDEIPEVLVVGKNIPVPAVVVEKSDEPSEIGLCRRSSVDDGLECETWQPDPNARGFNNIRLADLNCDGELDAIIGSTAGISKTLDGSVLLAVGPLEEGFEPTPLGGSVASVGNELAIGDVTDDGALDVIVPIYGMEGGGTGLVRVYSFEVVPE